MSLTDKYRKRGNQEIYERANGTIGVRTVNDEPSMTQQQFAQDCDVNYIMEKFLKTGTITHLRREPGHYLDLTTLPDYQESLQTVINAQNAFMELDADIRLKFDNDPGKFIEYLADETKEEEHIKLGLRAHKQKDPLLNELEGINKSLSKATDAKSKSPAKKNTRNDSEE